MLSREGLFTRHSFLISLHWPISLQRPTFNGDIFVIYFVPHYWADLIPSLGSFNLRMSRDSICIHWKHLPPKIWVNLAHFSSVQIGRRDFTAEDILDLSSGKILLSSTYRGEIHRICFTIRASWTKATFITYSIFVGTLKAVDNHKWKREMIIFA